MDSIAEIKSRINIEELVSTYVPLKKVGRQFKALCPFHNERTPSFYISPERGIAYCFGCRKGGDIFSFVQEIEGVDFSAALKLLADKAGVKLETRQRIDSGKKSRIDRLKQMHESATEYYRDCLASDSRALAYLEKRGIAKQEARKQFGATPAKPDGLYRHLLECGFVQDEITVGGLATTREIGGGECLDRFRNRLIIPLKNASGDVCAFAGRALDDDQQPKYLNSPETPLYHKSEILFGLSEARAAIRRADEIVIVEGYFDCLAAQRTGVAQTVASGGTALTEEHLQAIKRFSTRLILAFDQDAAGWAATVRALELALPMGFSIRVARWEKAKDPDELTRLGPELFARAIKQSVDGASFLVGLFARQCGTATIENKRSIVQELLPFWNKTKSPLELSEWIKLTARELSVSETALYDEFKQFQKKGATSPRSTGQKKEEPAKVSGEIKSQEHLVALLLTYPNLYSLANQVVSKELFTDSDLQTIYAHPTTEYNADLEGSLYKRKQLLSLYGEMMFKEMTEEAARQEVHLACAALTRSGFEKRKKGLLASLRSASGNDAQKVLMEYQLVLHEERELREFPGK